MVHIKTHKIKCPFSEFGCGQSRMDSHTINDHLNRENYFHTNLLLESIQNLNNEMNFLKENSRQNQVTIEELQLENRNLHNAIVVLKDEEIKPIHLKCKSLEVETKTLKNEIQLLKNNSLQQQKIIDEFIKRNNNREINMERKILKLENNQEISVNEIVELKKEFNNVSVEIKNSEMMINEFSGLIDCSDLNLKILCPSERIGKYLSLFGSLTQMISSIFTVNSITGGIEEQQLNEISLNRLTANNNNKSGPNTSFGEIAYRRVLRPEFNRGSPNINSPIFNRGGHRGRGRRRMSSPVKKTPEQKKEELDAELDAYMHAD